MQFTSVELLEMGRGVASGMKYLSEMGFIHRVRKNISSILLSGIFSDTFVTFWISAEQYFFSYFEIFRLIKDSLY